MNYYPFHIGDYLSATRHLSWEEDAAYRRLLDTYYTTEKPLPTDLRAVCRLVLAQTDAQREAVRVVLEEFFQPTPDGWVNGRADAEILSMREKQQKQRDKANKRWAKPRPESGTAPAMPRHEVSDAAASKAHADAMPPTPTPTPTPTPIKEKAAPAPLTLSDLVTDGLSEEVATAWLAHRKAKKAKLTPLAWSGFKAEAEKAGWSIEAAVLKAIARNWVAFEADWVKNDLQQQPAETTYQRSMRERMEQVAPSVAAKRPGSTTNLNPMEILDGLTRIAG